MIVNNLLAEFRTLKTRFDTFALPTSTDEAANPPFWRSAYAFLEVAYLKAQRKTATNTQAQRLIPREVFRRYPQKEVINLTITGMKVKVPVQGIPSRWALENFAHVMVGLAEVVNSKGLSLFDCPATLYTLTTDCSSFLWKILDKRVGDLVKIKARNANLRKGEVTDLTQDALLKISQGVEGFRGHCKFNTWITTIVINMFKDMVRNTQRREKILETHLNALLEGSQPRLRQEDLEDEEQMPTLIDPFHDEHDPFERVEWEFAVDGIDYESTVCILDGLLAVVKRRFNREYVQHHADDKAKWLINFLTGSQAATISARLATLVTNVSPSATAVLLNQVVAFIQEWSHQDGRQGAM